MKDVWLVSAFWSWTFNYSQLKGFDSALGTLACSVEDCFRIDEVLDTLTPTLDIIPTLSYLEDSVMHIYQIVYPCRSVL